jgi:hypothetical protein
MNCKSMSRISGWIRDWERNMMPHDTMIKRIKEEVGYEPDNTA